MYLTSLFLPFWSFLVTNIYGRRIGIYGCCLLSTFSVLFTFLLSLILFLEVSISSSPCTICLGSWFYAELFNINWGFIFDDATICMFLVVSGVSSLVHLYSIGYLFSDPHLGRFMGYLSLFTGFMLILVASDNFILMFLGWEGIGLASFLLIGFWNTRIQANKSSIKALVINRIGDLGLIISISIIFFTFKSVDYFVVFSLVPKVSQTQFNFLFCNLDKLSVISFLLFWGALGKSAQIGLHIWLPDAMEGPTPVSALIHAATLVTAGIFLIIKCSFIFENSYILKVITLIGSLTAFFAATTGLLQNDLKRVIAYSTCSQLGYMAISIGLSQYSIALFHLINHALFKALLFLSAGCIIHGFCDEQDMRKMGSLVKLFPISYIMILIGSCSLMGLPFLTGFYSKDSILESAIVKNDLIGNFAFILGCSAAFCTAFYSFRLIFLIFINKNSSYMHNVKIAHDGSYLLTLPLLFLSVGAITWGFISKDYVIGPGSSFYNNYTIYFENCNLIESEFLSLRIKCIPLICTFLGFLTSLFLIQGLFLNTKHLFNLKQKIFVKNIIFFFSNRWYFDQIINTLIAEKFMNFGYKCSFLLLDKGCIEKIGPLGITQITQVSSRYTSFYQSGNLVNYALLMLIYLVFFSFYWFFYFFIGRLFFVLFFCYLFIDISR